MGAKYRKHFEIFSTSIYALSKDKISFQTIKHADTQLNYFADKFEDLYGKSNITLNLHLLRHLAMSVKHLGPLWSQSAFAFEANNGVVVKANTSSDKIAHQLVWKYVMKHTIESTDETLCDFSLGGKGVNKLTSDETDAFSQIGIDLESNSLAIYKNVSIRGVKFTSQLMKTVSTIDYFVKLKCGIVGAIKFFTIQNSTLYACINVYEILDEDDHFHLIKASEFQKIVESTNIANKWLYMKFGQDAYVTSVPNKYEKA